MKHPRCADCGVFAAWNGYYGRWECSRCGRSVVVRRKEPAPPANKSETIGATLARVFGENR